MAKQPEFTKYRPLNDWFRTQPASKKTLTLTFNQVEKILDSSLPASSLKPSWWTNVRPKIQSHRTCWLDHGWLVDEYDQEARKVMFIRSA